MLALFRTNQLIVHALVLPYLLILWLPSFLSGEAVHLEGGGYIAVWLWSVLPDNANLLLTVALLLVWLQGLVLNALVQEYRMGPQATLLAGLALAWFASATPEFTRFGPLVVGNTFVVLALHQAYALYRHAGPAAALFNTGFLVSLAGLSYFPFLVLAPLGWFLLGIQRGHRLAETLQYLIGVLLPWFLLFALWYWVRPEMGFAQLAGLPASWPPILTGPAGLRLPLTSLVLGAIILYLLSRVPWLGLGETIQVQKNIALAALFLLGGGLSLLLPPALYFHHWLVCAIPAGLLMGLWLARIPARWAETVHFLLFAAALIYQYFPLL